MATGERIRTRMGQRHMTTTTDILTLTQLLSPSFPVGAFAYSHGLETAIDAGKITSAQTLQDWLQDLLTHGGAQSDAVLLNAAFATDAPAPMDAIARAFASSSERLQETDLQGAAFCDAMRDVWQVDLGRLCYPVAVGQAARHLQLDAQLTTAMYLQAMIANLCAAAMRLVPLGQVEGQSVQLALKPLCDRIALQSIGARLEDLHSCAWMSDIASMQHETQYSRIFRT